LDEVEDGSKFRMVRPRAAGMPAEAIAAALYSGSVAQDAGLLEPTPTLADLALRVLSIPNPQAAQGGRPGEALLMDFICGWLQARDIAHEANPNWGVHAVLSSANPGQGKPAVLLAVHLDSDNLDMDACSSLRFDREANALRHEGKVGLDCKLGVVMALAVLDCLRLGKTVAGLRPTDWTVHVLFTVGEESGQKGAIRAPLPGLLAGRVRHALVLDRMTRGARAPSGPRNEPIRHVVATYKHVPLLDVGCGEELMGHLEDSMRLLGLLPASAWLPQIESPNCADALELRGRWDAEVVAPQILRERPHDAALAQAVKDYNAVTETLRKAMDSIPAERRVSSMNEAPRYTRYEAMLKVQTALGRGGLLDQRFWFSCVNLSYDYDEDRQCLELAEVEETISIVLGFIALYFFQA